MTPPLSKTAIVAGLLALFGTAAQASAIFTRADIDFTHSSTSFGYLGQQFTFSDVSSGAFDFNPVGVTTAAGAAVTSLGAPFYNPPQPTTFFDPIRGSGVLVFDSGYLYSSFTRTPIPYSATASLIGLSLNLSDGVHYGFAEFDGTYLVSYGFESTEGRGIDVGQTIAAVPEPETYALLFAGLGVLGVVSRRRRASVKPTE